MTPAAEEALSKLRDPSLLQWYVIPLLALTVYIYLVEIEKRNWDAVFAGLAFWGMDWLNEIGNSVILALTDTAPLWAAPGETAYLILVGLNVEIAFMFSIAGVTLVKLLPEDPGRRILGLPNRLVIAVGSSVFCVVVEIFLNRADLLIWHYWWWDFPHVYLIVIFGYLHFNLVAYKVHDLPTIRQKALVVGGIYLVAAVGVGIFGFGLGWL